MRNATLIASGQYAVPLQYQHSLLSVIGWELRRYFANRFFWMQIFGFFALILFVMWASQKPSQFTFGTVTGFVAGTSDWGLLVTLPVGPLLLMALLLPFINADNVARDLSRHTHELLMTTPIPSWAYVWGRYITGLLMSLGLSFLMLAAIWSMGVFLNLSISDYPSPEIGNLLILYVSMVLPATIMVSSFSFALGTVFPRQVNLVKIVILVLWIIGAVIIPGGSDNSNTPSWYQAWDPTSASTAFGLVQSYQSAFANLLHSASSASQFQIALLTLENKMPDPSTWLAPHLLLAALSLMFVAIVAFTFQRFRHVLGTAS